MRGRVVKSTGSWSSVRSEDGKVIPCKIKGNFRLKGIRSTNPVAVGDWVNYEIVEEDTGVINQLEERNNYIIRKSIKLSKRGHILASNIDQVLVFITLRDPETTKGFIDRVIVGAEAYHITPILVFNKADLLQEEDADELIEWLTIYGDIGYRCIQTSVTENVNLDEVKEIMKGKTSMLAGHSGTGKSSLINAISPNLNLKIADISDFHRQGKHTTTFAEMYHLDFGAEIIDTPGIRGFGVIDIDRKEISHYFLEMRALLSQCKFNNCQHLNEPDCAVKQAVVDGNIAESRFKSYLSIYDGDENESYRTVDY
ncbi:MAG: ribosome small subunit-dependent GTPase A [Crocinitomicaceae bacterium]|nr:ribosome small subunit-dependent GTPase A [Crocinitomicaceae bacterium]